MEEFLGATGTYAMPKGYISILEFRDPEGRIIPNQVAVDNGWVLAPKKVPRGWGARRDEIGLGYNLFLDGGRQALVQAFGNTSPLGNYVATHFCIGTGTVAPNVSDVGLVNQIEFTTGVTTKLIGGVTFPFPFGVEFSLPLAAGEANGYLITEFGLLTDSGILLARKTDVGINKQSSFAPSILWRTRF